MWPVPHTRCLLPEPPAGRAGLSSNDFLRSSSVLEFSRDGMLDVAVDVQRMADKEGLTAHRASVDIRAGLIE